jgi:hypothetical protein
MTGTFIKINNFSQASLISEETPAACPPAGSLSPQTVQLHFSPRNPNQ